MASATHKKGFESKETGVEWYTKSKQGLGITEAAEKAGRKIYPLLEKVGTKPAEHANVCNIFKDNNMDYYHIVFPCPVKNCRSGESLSFSLLFITITPFHHSPLHHFIHF